MTIGVITGASLAVCLLITGWTAARVWLMTPPRYRVLLIRCPACRALIAEAKPSKDLEGVTGRVIVDLNVPVTHRCK